MHIYFNGDSNIAGTELADPRMTSMASRLAQRFDADFTSAALAGASNDYIYDQTMLWLNTVPKKSDLVVIGWSGFERIQWFIHGKFYEINNLGVGQPVPSQYKKRYECWLDNIRTNGRWTRYICIYWHNKIYNMHKFLEHKKIPHLFFNTFDYFMFPADQQEEFHLDWDNCFMSPYDGDYIYTPWCARQGYKEITPGWQHYPEEAHDAWAQLMYDHIKKHQII